MVRTLNEEEALRVFANNYIGNLTYIYQNRPFVVPITYFYDQENNVLISYSGEGHKINAMRKHNQVSLGVAEITSVND